MPLHGQGSPAEVLSLVSEENILIDWNLLVYCPASAAPWFLASL
jgi:hypothetical protein